MSIALLIGQICLLICQLLLLLQQLRLFRLIRERERIADECMGRTVGRTARTPGGPQDT